MNYQQAVQALQRELGRPISPAEIQQAFQRFGGNESSDFTESGLRPVLDWLRNPNGAGGGGTPPPQRSPTPTDTGTGPGANPGYPPPNQQFPYAPPTYTPPAGGYGGPPPTYTPPPAFSYQDYEPGAAFTGPTAESLRADPSYQFRMDQGRGAIENSRAAQGIFNGADTQRALLEYGQNFGSQEFQNVWNRDKAAHDTNEGNRFKTYSTNYLKDADAYKTNVDTQFVTPFNFLNNQWGSLKDSQQRAGEFDFNSAYNNWLSQYNIWRNTGNDWFDKQFRVANA